MDTALLVILGIFSAANAGLVAAIISLMKKRANNSNPTRNSNARFVTEVECRTRHERLSEQLTLIREDLATIKSRLGVDNPI